MLLGKGGFMVKAGDAVDEFSELRTVGGVGAVSIGTDRVGGCGESFVGNKSTVFCGPVHTCFDIVDLRDGDMVRIYHVTKNVARSGFLSEKVTTTRDTMGEW
jgi:hypothetical protein